MWCKFEGDTMQSMQKYAHQLVGRCASTVHNCAIYVQKMCKLGAELCLWSCREVCKWGTYIRCRIGHQRHPKNAEMSASKVQESALVVQKLHLNWQCCANLLERCFTLCRNITIAEKMSSKYRKFPFAFCNRQKKIWQNTEWIVKNAVSARRLQVFLQFYLESRCHFRICNWCVNGPKVRLQMIFCFKV